MPESAIEQIRKQRGPLVSPARLGSKDSRAEFSFENPLLTQQRLLGNQGVQRALRGSAQSPRLQDSNRASVTPIGFPYAAQIQSSLGTTLPLTGVVDQAGCARRGTPAFTDGTLTHFATATPSLHVAAHEATHQLQHAGATNDGGLGAEGQAHAVAEGMNQGRAPMALIGQRGSRVASTVRSYVDYDGGRLGQAGLTLTYGGKDAWAYPALISQASAILKAKKSGVELSAGEGSRTEEAPDGSGLHTLSQLAVKVLTDPDPWIGDPDFPADCGRAAREVMGPTGEDKPVVGVFKDATDVLRETSQPSVMKKDPREPLALILFVTQRTRSIQGYEKMSPEERDEIVKGIYEEYAKLSQDEKLQLMKSMLDAATDVSDEFASQVGMDAYAQPAVGEAYTIRKGKSDPGDYFYHFAAVIMVAGVDSVTFENAGGDYKETSQNWSLQTYGPASEGQSFHEEWKRELGWEGAHTIRVRSQPDVTGYVEEMQHLPTQTLFERYRASTSSEERMALEGVLKVRSISVWVEVNETEDWTGSDDVFVLLSTGGGLALSTGSVSIGKGQSHVFAMPISSLWPVTDPLQVNILEFDVEGDDVMGAITWEFPYGPKSALPLGDGDASYTVTLSM